MRPRHAQASSFRSLGGLDKARGVEPSERGWANSTSMKETRTRIRKDERSAVEREHERTPRSSEAVPQIRYRIIVDQSAEPDLRLPFWSPPRGHSLPRLGTWSTVPRKEKASGSPEGGPRFSTCGKVHKTLNTIDIFGCHNRDG